MTKKKRVQKVVEMNALQQINSHAAGIDIGGEEIYVAVPPSCDPESVKVFPTFTADLYRATDWLKGCGITTVAMESTGVLWVPLFEILEKEGFEVCLVNARHIKNVSGRKTDILDCQWIQQLHTYGLLSASFRPDEYIVQIRGYVRQRDMLVKYRSAHIQHMQKALNLMNLKLTDVLSDITGVTGMKIIRSIVAGERDPHVLAQFRDRGCKKSEEEIAKSLEGHYRAEQVFALKQALELYDFYELQIESCDVELEKLYQQKEMPEHPDNPGPAPKRRKPRKNQAKFDLKGALYRMTGVDLTRIDGIDALTAQKVLSEIGTDMHRWPTVKHFTSWLHLCPNNKITGGKVIKTGTLKTKNRATTALRIAAASLSRSKSALGVFYRRMSARIGKMEAITATAHKLAKIIYTMLKEKTEYCDLGVDHYEKVNRERILKRLHYQAAKFGFCLEPLVNSSRMVVS